MIEFEGTYFDGKSSRPHQVTISYDTQVLYIRSIDGDLDIQASLDDCVFAPPLGSTRRSFNLPDGGLCETYDLSAIETLEHCRGANRGMKIVHLLESYWIPASCGLACLLLCVWFFVSHGIPFLAEKAAYSVPPKVAEIISDKTLSVLDKRFLIKSKLGPARTAEVQELFQESIGSSYTDFQYRLELRKSLALGPNAFALPSGIIIMTDELVELAQDNHEIQAVFVHELTHVRMRHGLRALFQDAGVFLLISVLSGDVTSITSAAATFPTLLIESGYSREFEREADNAAGLFCIEQGWTTRPYQDILIRLSEAHSIHAGPSWLSSHPDTGERVRLVQSLE